MSSATRPTAPSDCFPERLVRASLHLDSRIGTELGTAKSKPVCADIERGHLGAADLGENDRRHAYGASADNEGTIPGTGCCASHRMRTDGEELDHCRMIE